MVEISSYIPLNLMKVYDYYFRNKIWFGVKYDWKYDKFAPELRIVSYRQYNDFHPYAWPYVVYVA